MKTYCLFVIGLCCAFHAFAEIRNGYETQIASARRSLVDLRSKLDKGGQSIFERQKIRTMIISMEEIVEYYEITASLLIEFKEISPSIYSEIDEVKDLKGRPVDIYVRVIPSNGGMISACGATYLRQSTNDEDLYFSEYGSATVSVKIWNVKNSLQVLAHECGHVRYQVPNLASYMAYHKRSYRDLSGNYFGHDPDDPSGEKASEFEKRFRNDMKTYRKAFVAAR